MIVAPQTTQRRQPPLRLPLSPVHLPPLLLHLYPRSSTQLSSHSPNGGPAITDQGHARPSPSTPRRQASGPQGLCVRERCRILRSLITAPSPSQGTTDPQEDPLRLSCAGRAPEQPVQLQATQQSQQQAQGQKRRFAQLPSHQQPQPVSLSHISTKGDCLCRRYFPRLARPCGSPNP